MHIEYTAVVKQKDDCWIGWIEEVPGVNCQERTHQELIESLKTTLQDRHDAIASAGTGYKEEKITVTA